MSDGPWSAAFDFIDRFLNNYAIWFWLLVFFCLLWLAGWMGYVSFAMPLSDFRNTSNISGLLVFCLFLNSINAHIYIFDFISGLFELLVYLISLTYRAVSRSKKRAKRNFGEIISSNCRERIWLVWYIFEWEPKNKYQRFTLVHSRTEHDSYPRVSYFYNSLSAYFLLKSYNIFYTLPEGDSNFWYRSEREFSRELRPLVNLFDEIEELLNHNPVLRTEISEIAEKVKGKQIVQLYNLERELDWYSDIIKPATDLAEYDRRRQIVKSQRSS